MSSLRSSDVPNYMDMVKFVFERTEWDSERFGGYRCKIDYPIYGTQVSMALRRPAAPLS
jgi:hypothetical protein